MKKARKSRVARNKNQRFVRKHSADGMPICEFTNSTGVKVILRGIPPLKQTKIQIAMEDDPEWGARPATPTYTMDIAGGTSQEIPHNETTLETDEDKLIWDKWLEACEAWDVELAGRLLVSFLWDGVRLYIPPKWIVDNADKLPKPGDPYYDMDVHDIYAETVVLAESARWVRNQKMLKIDIPTDLDERLLHYYETVVIGNKKDAIDIGAVIRDLSGIDMEAQQAATNLFPGEAQEPVS